MRAWRLNHIDRANNLATYISGMADATSNEKLKEAAELIAKLADNMCGQGYVGCRGGYDCESDHK